MMGRTNSVAGVSTKLFEEGWDKIGGSRSPGSLRHMARAAQGASPAFFKMIRTGSCSSKEQLSAQFNYLFSKSVDVHDSRGLLDGEKRLTPEQIERAVSRWTEEWRGQLNAARTSHMVMSFPRGAKSNHVSLIAGEICKEKLGGRFDYMIAVHTDSPNKNPHAHIIVNRRGEDGDILSSARGLNTPTRPSRRPWSITPRNMAFSWRPRRVCSAGISIIPPPMANGGERRKRRLKPALPLKRPWASRALRRL
jgi:type IV secretion system T-DNA border endonuclease VirD2